jgi:hypothetical protein
MTAASPITLLFACVNGRTRLTSSTISSLNSTARYAQTCVLLHSSPWSVTSHFALQCLTAQHLGTCFSSLSLHCLADHLSWTDFDGVTWCIHTMGRTEYDKGSHDGAGCRMVSIGGTTPASEPAPTTTTSTQAPSTTTTTAAAMTPPTTTTIISTAPVTAMVETTTTTTAPPMPIEAPSLQRLKPTEMSRPTEVTKRSDLTFLDSNPVEG